MHFTKRLDMAGKHAFLSPSNYHWINYNDQKLEARYRSSMAARQGTELHNFAHEAIRLGIRMGKSPKTLNLYVNDAITYGMTPELCLFYSPNAFGHADTIVFRKDVLRVHDLKTGVTATSEWQLFVYAALFCLEYGVSPYDISMDLRIYQNDEIRFFEPHPDTINRIMDKIVYFDQMIEALRDDEW